MMVRKLAGLFFALILIVGFLSPSFISAQSVDDLYLMTENYPPYNFEDHGKLQGISVDLMVLMLKKLNSKQSRDNIHLLPWARGYTKLLEEKNTCLFATTRTKEREKLFKWVGPISSTTIALTARKDKHIKINSIKDIMKYRIGVVRDGVGEQLLVAAGIGLKQLDRVGGVDAILKSIKKLNYGRIDAWAYEENVVKWSLKANGFNPNDYETVYKLKEGELYYAFHKDTPVSLLQKFQKALDELKKEGEYQKILNKYLK